MKITERIRSLLARYRRWQRQPLLHIATRSEEEHFCNCCENHFTGNFCPTCGQKAEVRRITWASIRSGVMDLWGLGTRSMPYTLWQLIWRPGYMIADYLGGRRQVSFPPIKMLVFVALFVYFIMNYNHDTESDNVQTNIGIVNTFADFLSKHFDWATLFVLSFLIIPTYFIFRYSPRVSRHTLPEGFFIQVFMSVKWLMCTLVFNILEYITGGEGNFEKGLLLAWIFFMYYRTYRQLFGYGIWATVWRIIMVLSAAMTSLVLLIAVVGALSGEIEDITSSTAELMEAFLLFFGVLAVIIFVANRIGYYTAKRAAKKKAAEVGAD